MKAIHDSSTVGSCCANSASAAEVGQLDCRGPVHFVPCRTNTPVSIRLLGENDVSERTHTYPASPDDEHPITDYSKFPTADRPSNGKSGQRRHKLGKVADSDKLSRFARLKLCICSLIILTAAFATASLTVGIQGPRNLHAYMRSMMRVHKNFTAKTNRFRVIASMTTVPSRIDKILPVIESVFAQTARIERFELNIPHLCLRTNQVYIIPAWLEKLQTEGRLYIYRTEDYGAITKVAPTLLRYQHKRGAFVWSLDDDRIYPSNTLTDLLLSTNRSRPSVMAFVGADMDEHGSVQPALMFPPHPVPVSIIKGYGTVLYPPSIIKSDFLEYLHRTSNNSNCRKSDDIIISNYLAKHNITRLQAVFRVQKVRFNGPDVAMSMNEDAEALQNQDGGHTARYIEVVRWLHQQNLLYLPVPQSLLRGTRTGNQTRQALAGS
jgi:hypothetical protein